MEQSQEINTINAAPVSEDNRITVLDSLRGIAILGILLMNIPGFALPEPLCYGDLSLITDTINKLNLKTMLSIDLTIEGSQRALFSMLFGAGMILFLNSKEKSVGGMMAAEYYFRRQLWLLLFGLINAYVLLWFWDILFQYALAGMILFAFRRLSSKNLIIAAALCLVIQTVRDNVNYYADKQIITTGEMLSQKDTSVVKLDLLEKEKIGSWTELKEKSTKKSKEEKMEKSLLKVRGGYSEFYAFQSERSLEGELFWTFYGIWGILIFMFLGMAFYKNGILLGNGSMNLYLIMLIVGLGLGGWITWLRKEPMLSLNFNNYEYIKQFPFELYEISRSLRAIGIFGLIMLLYKSGMFKWFFALMRPVGQMAFTNYLMQSFMCGLFFYGIGFGMYGKLQYYEMYYVVAIVWLIEILWSYIWLTYFRFGPLEWLWRSLTYWKWQPMRK